MNPGDQNALAGQLIHLHAGYIQGVCIRSAGALGHARERSAGCLFCRYVAVL